jgi:ABC-type transport system involved in multi-copper enzyme maturation permease subunit
MTPRTGLLALRLLVRDTFRQTLAEGVTQLALLLSVLSILACLTVTIEPAALPPEEKPRQEVRALFGVVRFEVAGERAEAVDALQGNLASLVADTVGVLLLLLWTAAVLPSFLAPSAIAVLLAKPVPRWSLLAGKCLGVFVFASLHALLFVGGTWLALGWRTGLKADYLLCLPLVLLQFTVFFSFSVLLAVATRNTVACVFGTFVFWLFCWAMNFGRHAVRSTPDLQGVTGSLGGSVEFSYWLLPRPLDMHLILTQALGVETPTGGLINLTLLIERGYWAPALSVLASLLFAAVLFLVAVYDFLTADY